jgi:hypothetical protein
MGTLWRSRTPLIGVGLLLSAFFTYLAVKDVDWDVFWEGLRTSHYVWLLSALAVFAVSLWVRATRWPLLFQPKTRPPIGPNNTRHDRLAAVTLVLAARPLRQKLLHLGFSVSVSSWSRGGGAYGTKISTASTSHERSHRTICVRGPPASSILCPCSMPAASFTSCPRSFLAPSGTPAAGINSSARSRSTSSFGWSSGVALFT